MDKNVYLINDEGCIIARSQEEAEHFYASQTNLDIGTCDQLDTKTRCTWGELKEYSREYIQDKDITFPKTPELGDLTVLDGHLFEWRKMNEVIEELTEEMPFWFF